MISVETIIQEYRDRKNARGDLIHYMQQAQAHFNGDVIVPLPEMEKDEKPAVANLMVQGLDQTAMRIASVLPDMEFPPVMYGRDKGAGSEDWAHRRRLATMGWWQASRINLKMRRMARWTVGYGTAPMMVRPDFQRGIPKYSLRNPLTSFPALQNPYEDEQPDDVIYAYSRTFGWIESHYPEAARQVIKEQRHTPKKSSIVELLEWNGPEERVLLLLALRPAQGSNSLFWTPNRHSDWTQASGTELMRTPNRAGISWGVQNNRITVDQLQGQFQQTFGIYQNQARLMALETIAVEKAIFPDLVIQGSVPGRTPVLINGQWADGRSGDVNVVRDGTVQPLQLNPGFMTQPLIDRHERNIRQAGVPSQFSGEAPTGIATGRMGSQVLSASVDFPIQEYQEGLAVTLEEANKRAIAIAKAYFGEQKKSFHVSFNGARGNADYTPDIHFETDEHYVRYAAPGADVNSLVIGIGQRIGIETMSTWTAMQQDPMVPDPEFEYRKVKSEKIQRALLEYVSQAVQSGALDPQDVIILWEELERGANIADSWKKAQAAAQKRQAEAAAAAQEAAAQQGQMGMAGAEAGVDPAMQAGLSPGVAPEEAGLAIQGPNPNQQNLASLLGALRQPKMIGNSVPGSGNAPNVPVGG